MQKSDCSGYGLILCSVSNLIFELTPSLDKGLHFGIHRPGFKSQLHQLPAVDIEKITESLRGSAFSDNQCGQKDRHHRHTVYREK